MDSLNLLNQLQDAVIKDNNEKLKKSQKTKYEFDQLALYFGEDFTTKSGIIISQPTIGDILEYGEKRFYQALSPFLSNSTTIRLELWDMNPRVDWNYVKDIEVFDLLIKTVDKEPLKLLFKNISFDDFLLIKSDSIGEEEGKFVLYSPSQDLLIDEDEYNLMAEYIRTVMNNHPKEEKVKNKTGKEWIIQEERMNLQQKLLENKKTQSALLPLVSTCVNHPGFKYKLQELKEVGICQFFDSVNRILKYESSIAALRGSYSGFVDTSKMDKEVFNFMGDLKIS